MKAWQKGAILGISYVIVEIFYRGWASNYIRDFYLASFGYRQIIATAAAILFSLPFEILLSILGISHGLPQRIIGVFAGGIGATFFYLPLLITPAFIGYLVDLRCYDTTWKKGLSKLKSRKNLKKGFLYFALLVTVFSIILYLPEPEMVRPKEKMSTISSTPVFQFRLTPIIYYPSTSITTSIGYVDSKERISAAGGHIPDFGRGRFITLIYPLQDGTKIEVSVTERMSFMKYVDFVFREFHYYFTVNASQHPSPEELEVIDYLIDGDIITAEATGYGPYINPPSSEELKTINYLKEESIPPFGTRLRDVNFTDIKPLWEEK